MLPTTAQLFIIQPLLLLLLLLLLVTSFSQQQQEQRYCDDGMFFSSVTLSSVNDTTMHMRVLKNTKFWIGVSSSKDSTYQWSTTGHYAPTISPTFVLYDYDGTEFTLSFRELSNTSSTICTKDIVVYATNSSLLQTSQRMDYSVATVTTVNNNTSASTFLVYHFEASEWTSTCAENSQELSFEYSIDNAFVLSRRSTLETVLPYGKHSLSLQVTDSCGTANSSSVSVSVPGPMDLNALYSETYHLLDQPSYSLSANAISILLELNTRDTSSNEDLQSATFKIVSTLSNRIVAKRSEMSDEDLLSLLELITSLQVNNEQFVQIVANMNTTVHTPFSYLLRKSKILSNILVILNKSSSYDKRFLGTLETVTRAILQQQITNEPQLTVRTKGFEMSTNRIEADMLPSVTLPLNCSNFASEDNNLEISYKCINDRATFVSLPSGILDTLPEETDYVTYSVITYYDSPFPTSTSNNMVSYLVEVAFRDDVGGKLNTTVIPATTLFLQFEKLVISQKYEGSFTYQCKMWVESSQTWSSKSCKVIQVDQTFVTCSCSSVTGVFSVFRYSDEIPDTTLSSIVIEIIMNSFYMLVCTFAIFKLFMMREKQPVKSRFIAPFIGVVAIILDSAFDGLAKNILYLFLTEKNLLALDILEYIIWLVANPAVIISLFVYLWQQIRFITFKNLYQIMSRDPVTQPPNHRMRLCQYLVAKSTFAIVTMVAIAVIESLYIALVVISILVPRLKSTMEKVQALTYGAIVISLGFMVIATFIIDIISSIDRRRENNSTPMLHTTPTNVTKTVSPIAIPPLNLSATATQPVRERSQSTPRTPTTTAHTTSTTNLLHTPTAIQPTPLRHVHLRSLSEGRPATPRSPRTPIKVVKEESIFVDAPPTTIVIQQTKDEATNDFISVFTNFFTKHDYFMFRFESIFLGLTVLVLLAYYGTLLYTKYYKISDSSEPIVIVQKILEKFFKFIEKLAFGGFIVLTITLKTIFKLLRKSRLFTWLPIEYFSKPIKKRDKSKFDQMLLELLQSDNGYRIAFNFYRQEFALEKVLLWKDLTILKSKPTIVSISDFYRIYHLYVPVHSEREVALSHSLKYKLHRLYYTEHPDLHDIEKCLQLMYDELLVSMKENFSRLERTVDYKMFVKTLPKVVTTQPLSPATSLAQVFRTSERVFTL